MPEQWLLDLQSPRVVDRNCRQLLSADTTSSASVYTIIDYTLRDREMGVAPSKSFGHLAVDIPCLDLSKRLYEHLRCLLPAAREKQAPDYFEYPTERESEAWYRVAVTCPTEWYPDTIMSTFLRLYQFAYRDVFCLPGNLVSLRTENIGNVLLSDTGIQLRGFGPGRAGLIFHHLLGGDASWRGKVTLADADHVVPGSLCYTSCCGT